MNEDWREFLPAAWQALPLNTRAHSLCEFDTSLYTPTERISARAKRLAEQPIEALPQGFVDDLHSGLAVRYGAKQMERRARERARIHANADRRDTPPREPRSFAEKLGIDPKANENTVHGLRFGMVRKLSPRKRWVLLCLDTGIEISVSGETRPKMWESFAWFNHRNAPEHFRKIHGAQ
jgi:hypothetical protein